jgi:hypothetical protein
MSESGAASSRVVEQTTMMIIALVGQHITPENGMSGGTDSGKLSIDHSRLTHYIEVHFRLPPRC